MEEFILIILNMIIIFFTLQFLIKMIRKKMENSNISKWIRSKQERKYKIGGYMTILCIINLWLTISGKFHIISYIIFILTVGFIVFIGALTEG